MAFTLASKMSNVITLTGRVGEATVNINIPPQVTHFTQYVVNGIDAISKAASISLQRPEDLAQVFARGLEEPEIWFSYGAITYSAMALIRAIPKDIKDAVLSPQLTGDHATDKAIERTARVVFPTLSDEVKTSIAKLIILFYIDQVTVEVLQQILKDVEKMQDGVPYESLEKIPYVSLSKREGDNYSFYVNTGFDNYLMKEKISNVLGKYANYVKNLPEPIKDAIVEYTADMFDNINECLRGRIPCRPDIMSLVSKIDEAFANAPSLDRAITVYRGQREGIYDTKAFTSASIKLKASLSFVKPAQECCLYKITVTPKSKILPLEGITVVGGEQEILLDRDGKFVINKEETKTYVVDDQTYTLKTIYVTYEPSDVVRL